MNVRIKISKSLLVGALAAFAFAASARTSFAQEHGDPTHQEHGAELPREQGHQGQVHEVHAGQHGGQAHGGEAAQGHGKTHGQMTGTAETHSAEVRGHGGAHEGEHHALEPINWTNPYKLDAEGKPQFPMMALIINFVILLALYKFFPGLFGVVGAILTDGKTIPEFLKSRRKAIGEAIMNAQKLLKEAKGRASKYQAQLDNLDTDTKTTLEGLHEAGRAEKERVIREAEEKVTRLHKDSAFMLEQERKQLHEDLLRSTVERAVKEAETLLRAKVTAGDQERLAEEFLQQIAQRRGSLVPEPRAIQGDAE